MSAFIAILGLGHDVIQPLMAQYTEPLQAPYITMRILLPTLLATLVLLSSGVLASETQDIYTFTFNEEVASEGSHSEVEGFTASVTATQSLFADPDFETFEAAPRSSKRTKKSQLSKSVESTFIADDAEIFQSYTEAPNTVDESPSSTELEEEVKPKKSKKSKKSRTSEKSQETKKSKKSKNEVHFDGDWFELSSSAQARSAGSRCGQPSMTMEESVTVINTDISETIFEEQSEVFSASLVEETQRSESGKRKKTSRVRPTNVPAEIVDAKIKSAVQSVKLNLAKGKVPAGVIVPRNLRSFKTTSTLSGDPDTASLTVGPFSGRVLSSVVQDD